jgi:CHAT domain
MSSIPPCWNEDLEEDGAQGKGGTDELGLSLKKLDDRDALIARIRELPAVGNTLGTPSFDTHCAAASQGPVIMINHCEWRSDILLNLHGSPPSLIHTSNDFYHRANAIADRLLSARKKHRLESMQYRRAIRSVLKELYELVGRPVIDRLRTLNIPEQSRVWWCPTSVFCSLPLHAMGPIPSKGKGKKYFSDMYISSYTPTLSALVQSRESRVLQMSDRPSLAIIAPPEESLPGVKEEIEVIKRVFGRLDTLNNVVVLESATSETVIDTLQEHHLVHFACRGSPRRRKTVQFLTQALRRRSSYTT